MTCNQQKKNSLMDYLIIFCLFIIISFLAKILSNLNLFSNFTTQNLENISISFAFILGIIASLSTCLATLSGIVLSLGAINNSNNNFNKHFLFHISRMISFLILGGMLGYIGSVFKVSVSLTGILIIIISIFMLFIALNILNLLPHFKIKNKFITKKISFLQKNNNKKTVISLGFLSFFIPCGFMQSVQLVAVASGNIFTGSILMLSFALGTTPALLSIGFLSNKILNSANHFSKQIIGVIIAFISILSLNSGLVLAGSPIILPFGKTNIVESRLAQEEQIIKMTINREFYPNQFILKKDIPVKWEIKGVDISGCVNEIVVPKLNIRENILIGDNLVTFTPRETGTINFSCYAGIVNGQFIVR